MSRVFCAYSLCIALMFCAAAVMYICIFFHHVFCCLCLKVMFCFSGPQEWSWCRHSLQRQSSWRDFSWNGHVDHKYSNFRCENSFVSERLFFLFVNFVCILLVCHVISCCSPFSWRLKPQGLGGSYLQRVLRGFRMSIHLMFHVFAAFLAASFWSACAVFVYKINTCGPLGPFLFGFLPLCFSCVFSDKGRISPEFEPVAH